MYKVKNPCKFCYRTVTKKTGLKCEGGCQSWAHYNCLPYTPGKIKDIKAGYIKISCPCPNCGRKSSKKDICGGNQIPLCDASSVYSLSLNHKRSVNFSEKEPSERKNSEPKFSTASILRSPRSNVTKFRNSQVSFGEAVRFPSDSTTGYSDTDNKKTEQAKLLLTIMDKMYQTVKLFNDQIKDLKGKVEVVLEKK